MSETVPSNEQILYSVLTGDLVRERGVKRREAVTQAKNLSGRRGGRVTVRRSDGWEKLIYKDGELLESTLVTLDRRRADRRLF